MSNSLIVKIGMDRSGFAAEAEAARKDMVKFQGEVNRTSLELAGLRRAAREAGGGTSEQVAQIKQLETSLKSYQRVVRETTGDYKRLQEASNLRAPVSMQQTRADTVLRSQREIENIRREAAVPRTQPNPTPRPSHQEDEPHAKGEHGRTQMLAHSTRSIMDMLGAGADPLMALKVEGPRLVQAFGGGLGAILGVGAAVAGLGLFIKKTVEETEKAKELRRAMQEALNIDPRQGIQSVEMLGERIKQVQALLDQTAPTKKGWWSEGKQAVSDAFSDLGQFITNPHHASAGRTTAAREKGVADLEAKRDEALRESVHRQKELNDLRERGLQEGEKQVRVAEIEVELAKKKADIEKELGIPELRSRLHERGHSAAERNRWQKELEQRMRALNGRTAEAERAAGLEEAKAELDANAETRSFNARRKAAEIEAPEVAGIADGGRVHIFDSDVHNKAIQRAKAELEDAEASLADVRAHNTDDREAVTLVEEKAAAWVKIVRSAREELEAVRATTREMQSQARGTASEDRIEHTSQNFDRRIKRARDEGDEDGAKELEQQKVYAVRGAEADYEGMSQAERAREKRAADRRNRLADAYEARHGKSPWYSGATKAHEAGTPGGKIRDASGPEGSAIPTSRGSSLIPDNESIPDIPSIPDNYSPKNLDDYKRWIRPGTPAVIPPLSVYPHAAAARPADGKGNADVVAAIQDLKGLIDQRLTFVMS